MKTLVLLFTLVIGSILGINKVLRDGSFLRFLDTHPDPKWNPQVTYFVGRGYMVANDLPQAATYFYRIEAKYPDSAVADDALSNYLECLDRRPGMNRGILIQENQKYLDRFPNGKHVAIIQQRIDTYRSSI